jgi:CRISPR-associated protein Csm3
MKLCAIYRLALSLTTRSGLHIGGSKDGVGLRSVNNPVLRDPLSQEPYIPGSSLKGKLRSLIETTRPPYLQQVNKRVYDPLRDAAVLLEHAASDAATLAALDEIGRVFGQAPVGPDDLEDAPDAADDAPPSTPQAAEPDAPMASDLEVSPGTAPPAAGAAPPEAAPAADTVAEAMRLRGPTRLLVRDLRFDEETRRRLLEYNLRYGASYTEIKPEVQVPRLPGTPNLRSVERVPAGSRFVGELLYRVFAEGTETLAETLDHSLFGSIVLEALRQLRFDALGGGGSRGNGQVEVRASLSVLNPDGTPRANPPAIDLGDLAPQPQTEPPALGADLATA